MTKKDKLKASLLPFKGKNAEIEIYIVTGIHGTFKIPESYCKECHLFVNAAQQAIQELDREIHIQVKSYWTRFARPLLKRGTHPPVMLINGKLIAQGYDVPDKGKIKKELETQEETA
jgi:hypothetical protein